MIRALCAYMIILATIQVGLYGQPVEARDQTLPIFEGKDLMINTSRLRPHRSQLWPKSAQIDAIFNNAQISYTVERGDYYSSDGSPRKGIRIRWVSNTHSFEDAAYIDAETFSIIKQTGVFGGIRSEKFLQTYYSNHRVIRTILQNDSTAISSEHNLKYRNYYHLIIMPYLFVSSDLEAGTQFYLPFYNASQDVDTLIKVNIVGNTEYEDNLGQKRTAWKVETDHGYAKLEWFLDKSNPPYLLGYRWRAYSAGKLTSDSKMSMTKWLEYEGDDYDAIIKN